MTIGNMEKICRWMITTFSKLFRPTLAATLVFFMIWLSLRDMLSFWFVCMPVFAWATFFVVSIVVCVCCSFLAVGAIRRMQGREFTEGEYKDVLLTFIFRATGFYEHEDGQQD